MSSELVIGLLVALLGAGGVTGAVVALFKARPEAGQISVSAAQGAVIVQTGVIEELRQARVDDRAEVERLREQLKTERDRGDRCEDQIDQLRGHLQELGNLRRRVGQLEQQLEGKTAQLEEADAENTRLRTRVEHLEDEVRRLGGELP